MLKIFYAKIFPTFNLINYSFLSYYFLGNKDYILYYIKKNILVYRITNIILNDYTSLILDNIHWDIVVEAHKVMKTSHPDVYKTWQKNYIRNPRRRAQKRFATINITDVNPDKKNLTAFSSLDSQLIIKKK